LFILSYLTRSPVLTLAKLLIDPSINSYHIFRKARQKRIYSNLRQFMLWKVQIVLVLKFLSGKKLKLIVDGTILPVANTNRTRTQRIKRFSGKVFWTKRKRNLYSAHYGKRMQFEELYYGVLVMVLCDKAKSTWFRNLVGLAEVYGDRGDAMANFSPDVCFNTYYFIYTSKKYPFIQHQKGNPIYTM
ncbi:MAG: hypothetical protein N2657_01810, partial [bacterium]|nr:hypothetical protein [bacterium]